MKRVLLFLSLFALAAVIALLALLGGRPSVVEPATDEPRGRETARPADVRDVPPTTEAERPAPEVPTAREEVQRTGERFGEWTAAITVAGRVELPAGVPEDPTLRVLVLDADTRPERLYGEGGIVPHLVTGGSQALPSGLIAVEPVTPDGSFAVPLPAEVDAVWVSVDGRFLFSPECTRVTPKATDSTLVLRPKLGGWLHGRVQLPRGSGISSSPTAQPGIEASLEPDANQFSLIDADSDLLFDRSTKLTPDGRYEFRAVDATRPYELDIVSEKFANFTRDALLLEAGRELVIDAELSIGARVSGTVVDSAGEPVADAEVAAVKLVMWGFPGEELAETRTAADGTFELVAVPPGKANVLARADGYLESSVSEVAVEDGGVHGGLSLTLADGNSVEGLVLWQGGGPAAGAKVRLEFDPAAMMGLSAFNAARGAEGSAETDEEGRFRIGGLGNGPFLVTATLAAEAGGADAPPWKASKGSVGPNTDDLELVLIPPSEVRGRVIDAAGAPVPEFTVAANSQGAVFFMPGEHKKESFEDADGRFVLHDLEEGLWEIEVRAPGFGPSIPLQLGLPQLDLAPLEIVLQPAAGVAGVVTDPDGSPVPGAKITLQVDTGKTFAEMAGRLDLPEAYADDQGAYLLSDLAPGKQSIVAKHPDFAASSVVHVVVEPGNVIDEVDLTLRKGGTLTGEVYGKEGEPLAGGQVFVQDPTNWEMNILRTEADGTFRVERLRPGTWQVTAMIGAIDPGGEEPGSGDMSKFFENMRFTGVEIVEGEDAHVVLGAPPKDPVTVRGTITHGDEPVSEAVVSFLPEGGQGLEAIKMDQVATDGTYEVGLEEAGRYLVQVQFFGGVGAQQQNIEYAERIPEGEEHELDIALPLGRISGTVYGPDRKPVPSARVTLLADGGPTAGTYMGGNYAELSTDDSGRYAFDFLRPGTYTVAAGGAVFGGVFGAHSAHGRVMRNGIRVAQDEHEDSIDFNLENAGDVTGVVRDPNGAPVPGAAIFVRDERGRLLDPFSMIATSPDGTFRYSGVAPGEYTVTARVGGQVTQEDARVRVRAGEDGEVELVLHPGTILLVRILDQSGKDVEGARVSVVDEAGHQVNGMIAFAEVMSGLQGGFLHDEVRVGPLAPGRYTVEAKTGDGRKATKPVTLSGQPERKLKVRIR